ncbi:MAG: aspartate aminotransferase family protein, partial [Planctomycetota bacterium]
MRYLVGGVNSPVRTFSYLGFKKIPVFVKAKGCYIYDEGGRKFIDLVSGWGACILGYNTAIYRDIFNEFKRGNLYFVGLTCKYENELAKIIIDAIPNIEKVRFVNSGTEAVATAIRLARAITGKDLILKFEGCYHGHIDYLLFQAGSGVITHSLSTSAGIPSHLSKFTIVAPFNNGKILKKLYPKLKNRLAGVILEGIPANMGVVIPENNFLEEVFGLAKDLKALVILDEIVTGFRVCFGGLQNLLNLKPDITTLGKVIGGGFPVGAIGGTEKIMNNLSPVGKVYQAGTFSGNPLSTFAGVTVLKYLKS